MKRLFLAMVATVAFAGIAQAQTTPDEQQPPKQKKSNAKAQQQQQQQKAAPAQGAARPQQATRPQRAAQRPAQAPKAETAPQVNPSAQTTARNAKAQRNQQKNPPQVQQQAGTGQAGAAEPNAPAQTTGGKKAKQRNAVATKASPPPAASAAPSAGPGVGSGAAANAGAPAAPNAQTNARGARQKPAPEQVQQIRSQHVGFRAQPRPERAPAATFNQNYRIQNAEQWQGPQYAAFRAYRPEWHDQSWYRSHYNRVEQIAGGYYYWNNGYWYPAWGYDPGASYYAYDGPIYVGSRAEPFDRVVADVQAELQQMGYYRGDVDGLVGPLTREAVAAYQADNGLIQTAAIDEPTLDSLGMG